MQMSHDAQQRRQIVFAGFQWDTEACRHVVFYSTSFYSSRKKQIIAVSGFQIPQLSMLIEFDCKRFYVKKIGKMIMVSVSGY